MKQIIFLLALSFLPTIGFAQTSDSPEEVIKRTRELVKSSKAQSKEVDEKYAKMTPEEVIERSRELLKKKDGRGLTPEEVIELSRHLLSLRRGQESDPQIDEQYSKMTPEQVIERSRELLPKDTD